ncbi:MAG: glycosyltransferase family 4 protein [Bacillota bacterium]|jgi:glycogen(starch) synthase
MKVLMLTWEYPPRSVGGLARHVEDLSSALAETNNEIHVVTVGSEDTPEYEIVGGVHIHRFEPYPVNTPDFVTWVLQLNVKMLEVVAGLFRTQGTFDIVHAHDWLTAFAGASIKHGYHIPLIATIHATEAGRNNGLHNEHQRYIGSVEWWLAYEAWRIIVCSKHMKSEIIGLFNAPGDKIDIVPNGVNAKVFENLQIEPGFKNRFAFDYEKIVLFVGRLVQEKGVQVLIESAPAIIRAFPDAKFVIAGKGPMEGELKHRAQTTGLGDKIMFTGYIDDETRNKLYAVSSVAVFPSLYEPFGIVALEGMAAGTPVVVSDTGGLSEIVTHGENGMKAYPGNANSLANNIIRLLTDEVYAGQIKDKAKTLVKKVYDWRAIANNTIALYERVLREYKKSPWSRERKKPRVWDYAMSFVTSRYEAPERMEETKIGEVDSRLGEYDLVGSRILANNHREGGN